MIEEIPVFDRRDMLPKILEADGDWAPIRTRVVARGISVRMPGDPVAITKIAIDDLDLFCRNGAAWYASQAYDGQAANDNEDWPLQKLLRTERNEQCLALAVRYRDLHDLATGPTQLIGREPTDLFEVQNVDKGGVWKGPKVVTGKNANVATTATRVSSATDETQKRAAAVPKKWNGDWPILAAIDAKRELAFVRAKLAYVPAILDAFEWSVVDGLTLEAIGKRLGAGSKAAKGEARARVFDGFGILDRYWRQQGCRLATPSVASCVPWKEGAPTPAGYYRSRIQPDMVFPKVAA